jgi:hypothetical protein
MRGTISLPGGLRALHALAAEGLQMLVFSLSLRTAV